MPILIFASYSGAEPLVLVGEPAAEATLVSVDETGNLNFRIVGQDREVSHEQLVRWSNFRPNSRKSEVVLRDGSRIVLADSWTDEPSWQLTPDTVQVSTQLFGKEVIPRNVVRAILIHAPKGIVPRSKFLDRLFTSSARDEGVRLINGDRWDGETVSIQQHKNRLIAQLTLGVDKPPLELPINRVAAITLKASESPPSTETKLIVGTLDGSLLHVTSLRTDEQSLKLRLACGVTLAGSDRRDVKYLFSKSAEVEYLSDRNSAEYRHVPYLQIPWKFQRDRNVLGGPLQSHGLFFAKGLGVHTASRLSYDLSANVPERKFRHFVASVALDEEAGTRGSVVFRVYLKQKDKWQQAFSSPIIRGGEPPLPVIIELQDATHLALLADFADRGDELDYANWLEARLE